MSWDAFDGAQTPLTLEKSSVFLRSLPIVDCGTRVEFFSFCVCERDCVSASANCLSAVFLSFVVEALLVQFSGLF